MDTKYVILNVANGYPVVDLSLVEDCPFPNSSWGSIETATQALRWARANLLPPDYAKCYVLYGANPINI